MKLRIKLNCFLRFVILERVFDMNSSFFLILPIVALLSLAACIGDPSQNHANESKKTNIVTVDVNSSQKSTKALSKMNINIQIGNQTFHATLDDNPTATLDLEE